LHLGYHGNGHHFEFFKPPKAATHYGGYSYKVSSRLMKGIQNLFKSPFFVSMATAAKFVQPMPIVLAYLVPLDVDGVPIKFHQFLFGNYPAMIICVFLIFLACCPFPWQRQPF
jgi:hypothetical protein